MENVEERIKTVEKNLKYHRIVVLIWIAVMVIYAFSGGIQGCLSGVARVERLEIWDRSGKLRAILGAFPLLDRGGFSFFVFDKERNINFSLTDFDNSSTNMLIALLGDITNKLTFGVDGGMDLAYRGESKAKFTEGVTRYREQVRSGRYLSGWR